MGRDFEWVEAEEYKTIELWRVTEDMQLIVAEDYWRIGEEQWL